MSEQETKEKTIYIVVDKKTNEEAIMLVGKWGIIPMFEKRKSAVEFMKEKTFPEDLKVMKIKLIN